MKRHEKVCKILKETKVVEFHIEKGILNTIKVCLKEKINHRAERDLIEKCFKKNKMRVGWGNNDCFIVTTQNGKTRKNL